MLDRVKVTPENRDTMRQVLGYLVLYRDNLVAALARLPYRPIKLEYLDFRVMLSNVAQLDELIRVLRERTWQAEANPTRGPSQNIAE